jgi:hypothetical protein
MAWQPDWERIATVGTALATLIGFGGRQAYLKGKFDGRMKDLENIAVNLDKRITEHDKRLGDGAVAFGRIDENLKSLKTGQERIENSLVQSLSEIRNLLINHVGRKE